MIGFSILYLRRFFSEEERENVESVWTFVLLLFVWGWCGMSCSSDADDGGVDITIPIDDDADCCSLEEEELTIRYVQELKELTPLSKVTTGIYTIRVYAGAEKLSVGYNELYFTVEKTATGRHVKDVAFSNLVPLMDMGKMQHSTPVGHFEAVASWIPVYRTWVSFLMPTDEAGGHSWSAAFDYRIKEERGQTSRQTIVVEPLNEGEEWVKSFKVGEETYYLSLVNPRQLGVGVNTVRAYLSKKPQEGMPPPFPVAQENFIVDITPTMPDMGNHTSPGNEALQLSAKGYHEGKLNLTMSGRWDIHLTVRDSEGHLLAGSETVGGSGDLYWSIII